MTKPPSQTYLDGMAAAERVDGILRQVRTDIVTLSVDAIRVGALERKAAAGDEDARSELRQAAGNLAELAYRVRGDAA